MTWINKRLQINKGSYGVLSISSSTSVGMLHGIDFTFTIFSYTDCGGKHQHNKFSFGTPDKAIKAAEFLYHFSKRRKTSKRLVAELEQEFKQRGTLYLVIDSDNKLTMSIGTYAGSSYNGNLTITKKQAKKIAGYLYSWASELLIGKRKVKIPAKTKFVLDIDDDD